MLLHVGRWGCAVRICGHAPGPPEPSGGWPGEDPFCCYGAVAGGWAGCTCWVPVFNVDSPVEPDAVQVGLLAAGIEPNTRDRMCADCAYRPGSPERTGDETYAGDADFLEDLASDGQRFWCHQGLLIVRSWRHPSGVEVPGHPGAYCPPIVDAVPYKTDGTAGELCAGWAARRRAKAHGGVR